MSDGSTPEQGNPTSSSLGGKRIPGQRSAAGQSVRDTAIRNIKEIWGVSEFVDIFPVNIRPNGDLGDSAISNLRTIAKKVPNLGGARALMISECIDASGKAQSFSFKHSASILKQLKAMDQTVKNEDQSQKTKSLNEGENTTQEVSARKTKLSGKPPGLPVSKGAFSPSERNAKKQDRSPASLFVASKKSVANEVATEKGQKSFKNTPAKEIPGNRTKALTPASKIGIMLDTPSVPKVRQRKEPTTGLHAPNREDVAPFRKTLASSKVPAVKKASTDENFLLKATPDKEIAKEANFKGMSTRDESPDQGKGFKSHVTYRPTKNWLKSPTRREEYGLEVNDLFEDGNFQNQLMTDDAGIPIEPGNKIFPKRRIEDVEQMNYGGLPFSKGSVIAEMSSKKRFVERHGHAVALSSPSEDDGEIGMASVSTLLRGNVHHEFSSEEAAEAIAAKNKATDAGVADGETVQESIVKCGKKRKFVASDDEADVQDDVNVGPRAGKRIEKRLILMPVGVHPKLDVPFTTYFDKPSKDIAELWRDRELARASIPQTPRSPIESLTPIHEINLFKSRPSSEISDPRIPRYKATTGNNLDGKSVSESTVPELNSTMDRGIDYNYRNQKRDVSDYSYTELVEISRAKAAQATKAGKRSATEAKDPMDYTLRELRDSLEEQEQRQRPAKRHRGSAPSELLAGILSSTPELLALPKLPETLIARNSADRVLITSVPAIFKAYVEELRARVAGGHGPDGDLLSMIIVNKYGYLLDHVDKLEKDLESLYYEALERNP